MTTSKYKRNKTIGLPMTLPTLPSIYDGHCLYNGRTKRFRRSIFHINRGSSRVSAAAADTHTHLLFD